MVVIMMVMMGMIGVVHRVQLILIDQHPITADH